MNKRPLCYFLLVKKLNKDDLTSHPTLLIFLMLVVIDRAMMLLLMGMRVLVMPKVFIQMINCSDIDFMIPKVMFMLMLMRWILKIWVPIFTEFWEIILAGAKVDVYGGGDSNDDVVDVHEVVGNTNAIHARTC